MTFARAVAGIHRRLVGLTRPVVRGYWTTIVRGQVSACGPDLRVNHPSSVSGGGVVRLGGNVNFNGMVIVGGGGLVIGDNFHSGVGCRILTLGHRWRDATAVPYDTEVVREPVAIGDNVWLGDRVMVMPGVTIGEGAIVGAGAVVTHDVEPCAVVAGVPARAIGARDRAAYDRLVAEGRFH